jgi:DNA-binding transcriptional regulator/RsmH inhibitor MraZ
MKAVLFVLGTACIGEAKRGKMAGRGSSTRKRRRARRRTRRRVAPDFLGSYRMTADQDGRLRLPARIREELSRCGIGTLYVGAKYSEPALVLCSRGTWEPWVKRLIESLPKSKRKEAKKEGVYPLAVVEVDQRGRFSPGERAMKWIDMGASAKGRPDVAFRGKGDLIEVWRSDNLERVEEPWRG